MEFHVVKFSKTSIRGAWSSKLQDMIAIGVAWQICEIKRTNSTLFILLHKIHACKIDSQNKKVENPCVLG